MSSRNRNKSENNSIDLEITEKQQEFIEAEATEVLFGGAAGGGKSYGQVIDAMLYALKYPKSKQIIFRKTYPELERSILRTMLAVYPRGKYSYNQTAHTFTFINGSIIDCGYLQNETDVYNYQSAEYDVIRFDELTHFTNFTYTYMLSRLRGANGYPKYMKSSTNPTGAGRVWVKERFVDIGEWNKPHDVVIGYRPDGKPIISRRIFIPSKVYDNLFLMEKDPDYVMRLENLPDSEKQGLLNGEWDYFEGQYFEEFRREIHVCTPFAIPPEWRRYRVFDYGLDMLACYWVAVDNLHNCYFYRELCESDLPISTAAQKILDFTDENENIYATLAPPDLWGRSQETGKGKDTLFYEAGLELTKSSNDREAGWLALKELMKPNADGVSRLHIFSNCKWLIKYLPELQRDEKHPTDCATEPHEITHSPDAARYFAIYWTRPAAAESDKRVKYRPDELEDYRNARTQEERDIIIKRKGGKPL
jgi:hypothetical protein